MGRTVTSKSPLSIILISNNSLLKPGIEAIIGREIDFLTEVDENYQLPESGILLLASGACSTRQRINTLSLIRRADKMESWRIINLIDERVEGERKFARLTGYPSVGLQCSFSIFSSMLKELLFNNVERQKDSIINLTRAQWSVILSSLSDDYMLKTKSKSSFYNHRTLGLRRINVKNIHTLRLIVTGCRNTGNKE
ncbi:hypothetical protein [Citrobacter braakii]|uniref:hypothetical protein n=1 Tax=Citrobacter braakii TaxID=57706 RepID=UPI001BCC34D4|nr:hypothetical protein [Citrobacter braakii]MEB2439823.1 hypothetical protein [Citrobacter braakii]